VERIAQAKGEIVEALSADGCAVLAGDDPAVAAMARRTVAAVTYFGALDEPASGQDRPEIGWSDVRLDDLDRPTFTLHHGQVSTTVTLRASGRHQVANATAAVAMARVAGVAGLDRIGTALAAARPASRYRMELTERADRTVVINDSYNANPASMRAALDTLRDIGARRGARTLACLGVMAELGEASEADHRALGEYAAGTGVDVLLTVGDPARPIHEAALDAGRAGEWPGEARHVATRAQALIDLRHNVRAGDIVLVKASRAAGLETLGEALADSEPALEPAPADSGKPQGQEGAATP
jgi:UDP-N-acetylmuramoyl-tripeptide--D-alanyl-D-alanine ligase